MCIRDRFYVRRFANDINRSMKQVLYGNLVHKSVGELEKEGAGSLLTKAVSDVDACVEGIRKFTTEIFDTGIALLAYAAMLLWYDWRLALLCLLFPPFSYLMEMCIRDRFNRLAKKPCSGVRPAFLAAMPREKETAK